MASIPEITQEARQEIAAAVAVLIRHQVNVARISDPNWTPNHQGCWIVPVGNDWDNTQAFRPFWILLTEVQGN